MKTYTSFDEIASDLRKLELEREIAKEELKILKYDFEKHLEPMNWVSSIFKFISKYGAILLLKRIFK